MKCRLVLLSVIASCILYSVSMSQVVWERYAGNPVLTATGLPFARVYDPSVLYDSAAGVYKMWFASYSNTYGISYATSPDGKQWTVHPGSPVLTASGSEIIIRGPSVLKHESGYRMWYTAEGYYKGRHNAFVICLATSSDGITWVKSGDNPVFMGGPEAWDSADVMFADVNREGQQYRMWYAGYDQSVYGTGKGKIGVATSVDGVHWTKDPANPVLTGEPASWEAGHLSQPSVIYHEGRYLMMYFGVPQPCCTNRVGYAVSTDGIHWTKGLENPVLIPGSATWESVSLGGASLLYRDDTLHYWYGGLPPGGNWQWHIGYATSSLVPALFREYFLLDSTTVGLWRFNEDSGMVVHDATVRHQDGTIQNAQWTEGAFGGALQYDGVSSSVTIPMTDALRPVDEFAIEAWFKLDTLYFGDPATPGEVHAVLLSCLGPYPQGGGYQISISNAGLQFSFRAGSPLSEFSSVIPITQAHAYYKLKATYQRVTPPWTSAVTVMKVYLNDVLVDSVGVTGQIHYTQTSTLYLGTNRDGRAGSGSAVREFPGVIDEVRISNSARTVPVFIPPPAAGFTMDLTARTPANQTRSLRFGAQPMATSGIDPLYGEEELPPIPPAGNFDARWMIGGTNGSLVHIQDTLTAQATSRRYAGILQPGPSGFPLRLEWNPSSLPPAGTFLLQDAATNGGEYRVNLQAQNGFTFTDSTSTEFEVVYSSDVTMVTSVAGQWNMLSVPFVLENGNPQGIFPGAVSRPFMYNQGYIPLDMIEPGVGFWLKYRQAGQVAVWGMPVMTDTIHLRQGWNMIGSIAVPIAINDIVRIPETISLSRFFQYTDGYYGAETLQPMRSYWVKSDAAGMLILSADRCVTCEANR